MNGKRDILKNLTLRKKIWICFVLIFLVAGMAALAFTHGFGETRIKEHLSKNHSGLLSYPEPDKGAEDRLVSLFNQLQQRMFWILGIVLAGIAALFFFMLRSIASRLDEVAEGARKMAIGHLNVSIPVHGCDEIGKIGETMNDLAANLQEILLALWNHTENCLYTMDRIRENPEANPKIPDSLENALQLMRNDLEGMKSMIKTFEFYDVCLENGKVTTLERAGKSERREQ